MDFSLLIIAAIIFFYIALLYYIFIIKKYHDFLLRGRATIFILLFFVVPIIVITLIAQSGAQYRLSKIGINPYPSISSSIGILSGTGENPIWLFSIDSDIDTTSIIKFYTNPTNHRGWILVSKSKNMLFFKKGDRKLSISVASKKITYIMLQKRLK